MFRRRDSSAQAASRSGTATAEPGAPGRAEGKGRPTPKRREAEKRTRPVRAPRDRKEAYRQIKARQKAQRQRARAGLAAGDERYLPARDQGPVRKMAREFVDSRRSIGEYFLYLSLLVIALTAVPISPVRLVAYNIAFPLLLVAITIDSILISRRVKRLAAQRYPEESTRGLSFYAISRGMQIRRLRLPPPQVKPRRRGARTSSY